MDHVEQFDRIERLEPLERLELLERAQFASVVRPTLLYISKLLKKVFLRVTLNKVKGLMYLKRRDSSLRSE